MNENEPQPIECRAAVEISPTTTNEILFLPIGLHAITPISGGIGRPIKVKVDAQSASVMQQQHSKLMAAGKRPYFDFNHEDGPASFWPEQFIWRSGEGVIARGEWSRRGKTAVEGKDFRAFSPVFHVDNKRAEAALVICKDTAEPNMGGLVNNPAFKDLPLWAKNAGSTGSYAGATGDNGETADNMNTEEIAALRAKQQELEGKVAVLESEAANNAEDQTIKAKLGQGQAELKVMQLELANAEIQARTAQLQSQVSDTNKKNAESEVKAAIQRGAVLPKDLNMQKELILRATADPGFLSVIKGMQGSGSSLATRITGSNRVTITADDPSVVFGAMAKVLSLSRRASDLRDKAQHAKEFATIYARELSPITAGANSVRSLSFPISGFEEAIKAGDVTDSDLGTLSGTLVTQRTLELLKFSFPALTMFTTDFSDQPAQYGQTVMTRTIDVPNVQTYNTTTGWTDSTATTNDVPIVIDNHKGVPITFNANILASTVRRLFDEFAPASAYALGLDLMNDLYGNITDANFTNNTVVPTNSFTRGSVITAGIDLDLLGVPSGLGMRTMLLYPTVFGKLEQDSALIQLAAFQKAGLITNPAGQDNVSLVIPVESFNVVKAPNLPTNDGNVTGFAGSKSALCIATRVPNDYTAALPGASFGNVQMVTDPDVGITVMLVQYVNHQLGTATSRIALMYGTAAGQGDAGLLIKAATGSGSSRTS
jgi:phage I-like protein